MGNWTRVKIIGTCAPEHVTALREHLAVDFMDRRWGCLHSGGLCGLSNWAAENIDALGNLGERDYTPASIAAALVCVAQVAPSLSAKVHVGGDYEAATCIATVVLAGGATTVCPPEIAEIPELDPGELRARLARYR